ncbi:MAG: hypothetical protein VR69_16765 [Peptococcaceae bacterium BRH_c4b]|nr:MAG: hypothetical protein VR69_16765 [Peptococcaceae bacterium BRH_c4b]
MQPHEINSLKEFMVVLEKLKLQFSHSAKEMDFSYRGVCNSSYPLLPGIYREIILNESGISGNAKLYCAHEYEILSHFIKEASSYISNIQRDDYLLWMEYAQHFGVPTRLLDFTSNPLVALYFCCKDKSETDGLVWVMNETNFCHWYRQSDFVIHNEPISKQQIINSMIAEMKGSFDYDPQKIEMKRPVSYIPYYIDQRMIAQSSRFLIWGTDTRPLGEMITENEYMVLSPEGIRYEKLYDTRFIFQFKISSCYKYSILKQLNICGINEKALFPGLDGIGRYIADIYRTNTDDLLDMLF